MLFHVTPLFSPIAHFNPCLWDEPVFRPIFRPVFLNLFSPFAPSYFPRYDFRDNSRYDWTPRTKIIILRPEYDSLRSLKGASFSEILEKHDLKKALSILSVETLKEKFEQEFGSFAPEELLKQFDLSALQTFYREGIVDEDLLEKIELARKEEIRSSPLPFDALLAKYSHATVFASFSVDELQEKFEEQYEGKTHAQILANVDPELLKTEKGRAVIGYEKFKDLGEITTEKDGVSRTFQFKDDQIFFEQTTLSPAGAMSYKSFLVVITPKSQETETPAAKV